MTGVFDQGGVLIVCSHPLSLVVCTFTSLIFVWLYYVSIAESG